MNIARVFILHRLPPFLVQGVWWEEKMGKSIRDICGFKSGGDGLV